MAFNKFQRNLFLLNESTRNGWRKKINGFTSRSKRGRRKTPRKIKMTRGNNIFAGCQMFQHSSAERYACQTNGAEGRTEYDTHTWMFQRGGRFISASGLNFVCTPTSLAAHPPFSLGKPNGISCLKAKLRHATSSCVSLLSTACKLRVLSKTK